MRRRVIQYLVLLSVFALSIHLYFNSAPEWLDDYTPFDFGPEGHGEPHHHRPYPPPPRQKDFPRPNGAPPTPSTSSRPNTLPADVPKRDAIVEAFKHAWSPYERDAMGYDEYHPISRQGSYIGYGGGIGYTVVDALDTMLLMGLEAESARAKDWIKEKLSFDRNGAFSTFETTIRVLGGLLSAHYLTGDELYLRHATDLGERILPVFDTSSGLPMSSVALGARRGTGGAVSLAEATTLQLEFRYLAQLTGRAPFWHKAERVMQVVNKARLPNGLAPINLDMGSGQFARSGIRMGSNGDSYYEYLLKQYLQTNYTEPVYLQMYTDAMQGVHDHLVQRTPTRGLTYIAELLPLALPNGRTDWEESWVTQPKQEHLACFLAGSLMLGATTAHRRDPAVRPSVPPKMEELTATGQRDWKTGVDYLEGCMATHNTKTGLSPEGVNFRTPADPPGERDWYIKNADQGGNPPYDARYMLRPEISESVFLAWRLTGDARYRDHAWAIFSAIERHCRLPGGGYATVLDVDTLPVTYIDRQETFFLSETLKYLFLTFADESVLSLHDVVFNTEAHPLPIFNPSIKPQFTKYS
ncbi:glycoside hydrolase family 47 protein [Mycena latifolia]|nr:glycoside hydrolase family 47 protein [Mycena latifolia]